MILFPTLALARRLEQHEAWSSSEHARTQAEFDQLAKVLCELGTQETLRGGRKQYTFWSDLPMQLESCRPPQYHQTLRFAIHDPAVTERSTRTTLRFRQVAGPGHWP